MAVGVVSTTGRSASAATLGTPVTSTMYYTRYNVDNDLNRVKSVVVAWDGANLTLNGRTGISTSNQIDGADGILFSNDNNHLVVGGQANIAYRVNIADGSATSQTATPSANAYHTSADPDGVHFWTGDIPGRLAEYRLDMTASGVGHVITGDDAAVDSLAWAGGRVFYTSSDPTGGGTFGEIDLSTFVTTRRIAGLPAAHGMSYDAFSKSLILYGADHISQIDPAADTVLKSDLAVSGLGSHFDQGAVDGKGHIYAAVNSGEFVFVDYSATKLVSTGIETTKFLDTFLDDVAPLSGPGSAPFSTDPGTSPVTVGTVIHDTATVQGLNPTGTVDFHLYGPSDPTCAATAVFNSTGRAVASNTATSANFTTTSVGTYHWSAHYSGDLNFAAEDVKCAEPVTTTQTHPAVTTQLSSSAITVGFSVTDQATLTGTTTAAGGAVTYHAYAGTACTGTDLLNSIKTVTNGVAPVSGSFTPAAAGSYQFQASYSGDADNAAAASVCTTELLVVGKTTPTVTTQLSSGTIVVGASVTDTAILTAVTPTAGGTVTYHAYAGTTCTGADLLNSTRTVTNGIVPVSTAFTPPNAGSYQLQASYSGDANNAAAVSACNTELLVVSTTTPIVTTQLSSNTVVVGSPVTDQAILKSVTATAGGTVTYHAYAGDTCTGTDLLNSTRTVTNGTVPVSGVFTPLNAGNYQLQASYSGDGNNAAAASACSTELLVVTRTTPSVTTQLSAGTIVVGASVTDQAILHSVTPTAGGTVTYHAYAGLTCTGTDLLHNSVTVTNGGAPISAAFTPLNAGSYQLQASYSGDANNGAAASVCNTELLVVGRTTPSVTTQLSSGAIVVGASVTDQAILASVTPTAGGTVTYSAYAGLTCTGPDLLNSTRTVTNGVVPVSGSFTPAGAGTYQLQAGYSGDANNAAAISVCTTERLAVAKASGTIATVIQVSGSIPGTLGQTTYGDQATITGAAPVITGETVTFALYGPYATAVTPTCLTTPAFTTTGVINAAGVASTSAGFTPTLAGTYTWVASWAGDANNNGATEACNVPAETALVAAPVVSVVKTADATTVTAPAAIGFTIAVRNAGTAGTGTATAVTINDQLPSGTGISWSISPAYAGPGTCSITAGATGQVLSCTVGNLAPGASASVHVTSATSVSGCVALTNTVTASAANQPTVQATAITTVQCPTGGVAGLTVPPVLGGVAGLITAPSTGGGPPRRTADGAAFVLGLLLLAGVLIPRRRHRA